MENIIDKLNILTINCPNCNQIINFATLIYDDMLR